MTNWIYKLLGIDPGQDTLRADRVFFVQPWPVWVALAAGVGILLWVLFFYLRDGTRPNWWWKTPMTLLRLAAVGVLVFVLWQPMLRSHRVQTTRDVVAVVLDESRSMSIRDRWQDGKRKADLIRALGDPKMASASRAEVLDRLLNKQDAALLRSLAEKHSVRVYRFGGDVRGAELVVPKKGGKDEPASDTPGAQASREHLPLKPGKPADEQTRIGAALDYVVQDTAGQPLAGIVLLSDGGQNMGEDPATSAQRVAETKTPIYTVG
ncbi:MAG TPA: hypothetical protein VFU47_15250, partial [Armatimonadota bacterium]|nr:hypothetical protein [Armatimonadota bacterium]